MVILQPEMDVDENQFVQAHERMGFVVGSEMHRGKESLLYRTAISFETSIQLLDASVCSYNKWVSAEAGKDQLSTVIYGQIASGEQIKAPVAGYSFDISESEINRIWFKYMTAIKKFARRDNLIGMHLLLDLVRDYLVVEMVERDMRENTHIHRFGYAEQLPASIKLSSINEADTGRILDYIAELARETDKKLAANVKGYRSRYPWLSAYIEAYREHVAL